MRGGGGGERIGGGYFVTSIFQVERGGFEGVGGGIGGDFWERGSRDSFRRFSDASMEERRGGF